jgi:hypothetical protein
MNRSQYPDASMSLEQCSAWASVQGAGAAAPTIPTTTLSLTSSIQPMTASDNYASTVAGDITRSGVGLYTVKLKDSFPIILDILPNVWGTDGKQAQMTDYNPTTRVITVKTYTSAGVAVDLASTDNLKFNILGRLSIG